MEILKVCNLKTYFDTPCGLVKAVDGISFRLVRGETLGIVGESGAGKSVSAHTVMGLASYIGASMVSGEVWYKGQDLLASPKSYGRSRGRHISLIPQEAAPSLNPVLTVAQQIGEMLQVHLGLPAGQRRAKVTELLAMVEIPDPELTGRLYPYQLSGGTIQRVLLAMALSCGPDIIIADEPASSLDVSVQSEILRLLRETKMRTGLSMVLIAHDLAVISNNSDHVLVMFRGSLMESGPTAAVLGRPMHPYTASLLALYQNLNHGGNDCTGINAVLPESGGHSGGCVYAFRCTRTTGKCLTDRPEPVSAGGERVVACHQPIG